MTHEQTSERFEKAHCLVKNTVALQEAENAALLFSMEIVNKPRSIWACFSSPGHRFARHFVEMKPTDALHLPM